MRSRRPADVLALLDKEPDGGSQEWAATPRPGSAARGNSSRSGASAGRAEAGVAGMPRRTVDADKPRVATIALAEAFQ